MDRITNRFVCYESYDWDRLNDLIKNKEVWGNHTVICRMRRSVLLRMKRESY